MDGGFGLLGGLIIGAISGGIGSFIVRYSYHEIIYKGQKVLIWEESFIRDVLQRLILNYLLFSFYGRARGKITNADFIDDTYLTNLLEEATRLTLKTRWKPLWEKLRNFQKRPDQNRLVKLIDKINPMSRDKSVDKNQVAGMCRELLAESNLHWIQLRNRQAAVD